MYSFALKSIKFSKIPSEESQAFTATLILDGKDFAKIGEDGFGGPMWFEMLGGHTRNDWTEIQNRLGERLIPFEPDALPDRIEFHVSDLLNVYRMEIEYKKVCRRLGFILHGKIYFLPSKMKPTAENIAIVKTAAWWTPAHTILQAAPREDVLKALGFRL